MKNILNYFKLLFLSILAIFLLYGGLNLHDNNIKTAKANSENIAINHKLSLLEKEIENFKNQNTTLENQINDLNKKLESYKYLAQQPKIIAGAENTEPPKVKEVIKYIEEDPVIQTITKTQYITKEIEKSEAFVTIESVGSYNVDLKENDTAFSILFRASQENGFTIDYQEYSFGVFITSIADIEPQGNQYWAFYYNGTYSQVGASDQLINKNDTTFWRLESF